MLGAIALTMTLVPSMLAWSIKKHPMAEKHSAWMHAAQNWYRRMLVSAQDNVKLVALASAGSLMLTLALSPLLGSEFLPKLDEGNIWREV